MSRPPFIAVQDEPGQFAWGLGIDTAVTEHTTDIAAHAARALAILADGSTALTLTALTDLAPQLGEDWMLGDDIGYALGGLEPDRRRTIVTVLGDLFTDLFSNIFGGPSHQESRLLHPNGRDSVPAFPGGVSGVARCIGWERTQGDTGTITPILATTGVAS